MAEKAAAKSKSKKAVKTVEPVGPPSVEEALQWSRFGVDDWSGENLGRVSGLHVDAQSGEPKWLVIRMGMLAGEAAIPFAHCAEAGGTIWAAYERETVRKSPKLSSSQALNARQELQLCEHYGIGISVGRAAELVGRDGDEVSAVPATG